MHPGESELAARIDILRVGLSHADRSDERRRRRARGRRHRVKMYGLNRRTHRGLWPQVPHHPSAHRKGVRFIQLYSGGGHIEDTWDGHNDCITNHKLHAGETDKPIAALIADLKRTGLWDETLLVWAASLAAPRPAKASASRVATTTGTAFRCGSPELG